MVRATDATALPPSLTDGQAISTVTWLAGPDILQGDPRLGGSGHEVLCWILAGSNRDFALWPDGSLDLPSPAARDGDARALVEAYRRARARLEALGPSVRLGLAAVAARHWPVQPASTLH